MAKTPLQTVKLKCGCDSLVLNFSGNAENEKKTNKKTGLSPVSLFSADSVSVCGAAAAAAATAGVQPGGRGLLQSLFTADTDKGEERQV